MNGNTIIPIGGYIKIPTMKAIIAPHSLFLLPPNLPTKYLFVNMSEINKIIVKIAIDIQNIIDNDPLFIKKAYNKKPIQTRSVAGKKGITNPIKLTTNAIIISVHMRKVNSQTPF